MKVKVTCCDCGKHTEVEAIDPSVAQLKYALWLLTHGDFPDKVKVVCACGDEMVSGPVVHEYDSAKGQALDKKWFKQHKDCVEVPAGQAN